MHKIDKTGKGVLLSIFNIISGCKMDQHVIQVKLVPV